MAIIYRTKEISIVWLKIAIGIFISTIEKAEGICEDDIIVSILNILIRVMKNEYKTPDYFIIIWFCVWVCEYVTHSLNRL